MPNTGSSSEFIWDLVGIPLVKGVDLNTRTRLVQPDVLVKAENVYFPRKGGPEKRRGHTAHIIKDSFDIYQWPNPPDPQYNMYGYGLYDPTTHGLPPKDQLDATSGPFRSVWAQAGTIKEVMTRDDEVLAWDGWRLFSHFSNGNSKKLTAMMPSYESAGIAKVPFTQDYVDAADNGKIRVVGYVKYTGTPSAEIKVYDSLTGALKFTVTNPHGGTDPDYIRVVPAGHYCNVLVSDNNLLYCVSIHENDTEVTLITPVQEAMSGIFDVWKYDESKFIVVSIEQTTVGESFNYYVIGSWCNANGTINTTTLPQAFRFSTSDVTISKINVAVAVHPITNQIGLMWDDSANQYYRAYDEVGAPMFAAVNFAATTDTRHMAIVPSYVIQSANQSVFYLYYDGTAGGTTPKYTVQKCYAGNAVLSTKTRYNVTLASKGCRIGNTPFIWTVFSSTLQTSYYLMDTDLLPVARAERGQAKENVADVSWLPSMNFRLTDNDNGVWQNVEIHGAVMYKQRIDLTTAGDGEVFAETSAKFYELNFTPSLSWSQVGRTLYIAGGQMWAYDGQNLYEHSFHTGPEDLIITTSNGAGALTNSGAYQWRVDWCDKNAFGEEIRSPSFLMEITGAWAPGDDTATIPIVNAPTRRTSSYYLVFRNENGGDSWYLVSNRDPQSAPLYSTSAATTTFTDIVADADIVDNEQHPANNDGYLQPLSAPACTVCAFGRDRLWIAGGELLPGEVWPSRLFYTGQVPSFNYALGVTIDTTDDPVTGISFTSDYTVVFKRNNTHTVSGPISPNVFDLTQPFVQLALADRGCISPKSVVRLTSGVGFQSEAGYRLMNNGGGLEDIGFPVDSVSGVCTGAVLVRTDEHVRFYQSDQQSVVLDYRDGLWSTFTVKPASAVLSPSTGLAILAMSNKLYFEDSSATDGGSSFYYTIRTAPIAKQLGGWQRVRRIWCVGEKEGIPPPVIIRVYYNGRDYYDQQVKWTYTTDMLTNGYGDENYGDGLFGDSSTSYIVRSDVWKWRRRLKKQKCESLQIELTDNGLITPTSKWVPIAFALEIGIRQGLEKLGTRTFSEV